MTKDQFNAALERFGWKQGQAAKAMGRTIRQINNIATGKYPVPVWMAELLRLWAKYPKERPKL